MRKITIMQKIQNKWRYLTDSKWREYLKEEFKEIEREEAAHTIRDFVRIYHHNNGDMSMNISFKNATFKAFCNVVYDLIVSKRVGIIIRNENVDKFVSEVTSEK